MGKKKETYTRTTTQIILYVQLIKKNNFVVKTKIDKSAPNLSPSYSSSFTSFSFESITNEFHESFANFQTCQASAKV